MSQFYDQASLVMVPSGYKAGKVYSQKPLSTDGELTFTRNSNATRVNADGLVEKVRTNVLLQSNTFSTTWAISGTGTVTTGANDPFGGTTAWTLAKTAANTFIYQSTSSLSGTYAFSIYAKAGTVDQLWLNHAQSGTPFSAFFDLTSGTTFSATGCVSTISSVGGGWYRCSIAYAVTSPINLRIYPASGGSISGTTGSILIYAAQAETGDIATDYIPTTSAAVSVGPTANVPRLNYSNGCPSLLLEPQCTALNTKSEDINGWLNAGGTSSANTTETLDPSGYYGADVFNSGCVRYISTSLSSAAYTFSCFAKNKSGGRFTLRIDTPTTKASVFNLITGTVQTTGSGHTAKIEDYGNGWYRCSITFTDSIVNYVLQTDAGYEAYVWGANLTQTSYLQSYVPTLGASVTRLADAAYKAGISSLIGQTEGTLFAEVDITKITPENLFISTLTDGTISNRIGIYTDTNYKIVFFVVNAGVAQFVLPTTLTSKTTYKIALAYKANDCIFYVNGASVGSNLTASIPATSRIDIGCQIGINTFGDAVSQTLLFKTRLTNAQLAELTTL